MERASFQAPSRLPNHPYGLCRWKQGNKGKKVEENGERLRRRETGDRVRDRRRRKRRKRKGGRKRRSKEEEREGSTICRTPGKYPGGRRRESISREYVCKTCTLHR